VTRERHYQIKRLVFFACVSLGIVATFCAHYDGFLKLAILATVIYPIEWWWVWRRDFGKARPLR
jgi:hypothetical protein